MRGQEFDTLYEVIRKARPNAFPIRLLRIKDEEVGGYVVEETNADGDWEYVDEGFGAEFTGLQEAQEYFDLRVKQLSNTPNWEAQAAYDDEHGTINGYAPFQYQREE